MHKIAQSGFTLIELMIVVAIMGILATMATPSFQERIIRAQVGEALALSEFAKESIANYYRVNKRMPKNNTEAGLPPPDKIMGNHVVSLEVNDGAINVKFGNRVNKNASGKKFFPFVPLSSRHFRKFLSRGTAVPPKRPPR